MKQPDRSNDPMSMPDGASRPGDYDERKLWFEFLKTVNDRHLQSAQRSGITSYVLVATILGLLYKFGEKFPSFYHGAGNLRSCGILFVLLGIGLSSLLFILASVMIASAGDSEFRADSERDESIKGVLQAIGVVVGVVWIGFDIWASRSGIDRLTRYILWSHAAWVFLNVATPIIQYQLRVRSAKNIEHPIPRFSALRIPSKFSFVLFGVSSVWFGSATACLYRYLAALPGSGIGPLKAASIALTICSLAFFVVYRVIQSAGRYPYLGLELAIVLNRLSTSQIRQRYLSELSGPDMAQWLHGVFESLEQAEAKL